MTQAEWTENPATWSVYERSLRAAMEWLEGHGEPFPDGSYSTAHNVFLWVAEKAFLEALEEYRAEHGLAIEPIPEATGFWLYRLWDERGRLLYVGVTRHPTKRLAAHRRKWGEVIAAVTWEERADVRDMLDAEATAIENECPALNVMHPTIRNEGPW